MTQHSLNSSTTNRRLDRIMEPEQFTQVVSAILDGKYSWACVLILRFAGYNPLHYIPYRTYNRITKDNNVPRNSSKVGVDDRAENLSEREDLFSEKSSTTIHDLGYLEAIKEHETIRGGHAKLISSSELLKWFKCSLRRYN